jgi:hypothetical protein
MPALAIRDVATGDIVAQGTPSPECMASLTSGLDGVYSRVALLIEQAIATPRPTRDRPAPVPRRAATAHRHICKSLAQRAIRAIYHLCCHSPQWRIGWRFNDGPGLLEGGRFEGLAWRPLYDSDLGFAADPFPVQWRGQIGVFFESMDHRTQKGAIKFQAFDENGPKGASVPCLEEPWHLSYPFLIEHDDALYMVPEASLSGAVTLYRCVRFPDRWEPVARLLDNIEAADATIFRHGGRYWMTSVVREGYGGYSDTLAIHHAESLFGPWEPHALAPALVDARHARPAGTVVTRNGALIRPVQDCSRGYGEGVAFMRIDRLDPDHFEQSLLRTLYPERRRLGGRHLHTINRVGRLEVIDGTILAPKPLPLRRIVTDVLSPDFRAATPACDSGVPPGGP